MIVLFASGPSIDAAYVNDFALAVERIEPAEREFPALAAACRAAEGDASP